MVSGFGSVRLIRLSSVIEVRVMTVTGGCASGLGGAVESHSLMAGA